MPEPSPTILLIEDDEATSELYQRELKRAYTVLACDSESEALALLQSNVIGAIVLEPAMHSGQGWAILEVLHTMPHTRTIPVILCSTLDERRLGMELGATRYLIKPVLPRALLDAIHRVI